MRRFIDIVLWLELVFITGPLWSQKKVELEKMKYKTQQEIDYSAKLLEETQKNQKKTLENLSVLNYQIEKRGVLIQNLEAEIDDLDYSARENEKLISALSEDLDVLKAEYVKILRYSSMMHGRQDILMFLLASGDVTQAYNRMMYVRRYAEYRDNQIITINKTIRDIQSKKDELDRLKRQKSITVNIKEKEAKTLKIQVKEKGELVGNLKRRESELRNTIREKERIAKELEKQIIRALEEERSKVKNSKEIILTPEEKIISGDFQKNKGRLPWPTARGIITGKYGMQEHPLVKNTMIQNNGIDITTESGSDVRALFEGTVTRVAAFLGANYTVIIKHGNFYTVYQNLTDVGVSKGQKVKMKQKIGVVYDGNNNVSSVLHLEIWQNFDRMSRLNPEDWLSN